MTLKGKEYLKKFPGRKSGQAMAKPAAPISMWLYAFTISLK